MSYTKMIEMSKKAGVIGIKSVTKGVYTAISIDYNLAVILGLYNIYYNNYNDDHYNDSLQSITTVGYNSAGVILPASVGYSLRLAIKGLFGANTIYSYVGGILGNGLKYYMRKDSVENFATGAVNGLLYEVFGYTMHHNNLALLIIQVGMVETVVEQFMIKGQYTTANDVAIGVIVPVTISTISTYDSRGFGGILPIIASTLLIYNNQIIEKNNETGENYETNNQQNNTINYAEISNKTGILELYIFE